MVREFTAHLIAAVHVEGAQGCEPIDRSDVPAQHGLVEESLALLHVHRANEKQVVRALDK